MRLHYKAVKVRMELSPTLVGRVHNALLITNGEYVRTSYVLLYGGGADELDDDRLASVQTTDSDAEYEYRVRSVGATVDAVMLMAEATETQLVGFAPIIPGRSCNPMWLDDSDEIEPDYAIKDPLYFMDQWFRLKSNRA